MRSIRNLYLLLFMLILTVNESDACTNFLVTKGASTDGSTMITYNADAGGFMEPLVYLPAQKYAPNDSLEVYDWDTGKYLGKIKQATETFLVTGNINEYQVSIGETTFTGRTELQDTNGIMDYGSLIRITLQRAKTAREAIQIIGNLVSEYGYYSTGESFSIADPNEVWIMELIGKGGIEKGAVWVAVKIPDGYIAAHANQARIRNFPLNEPDNCIYSKDVISFAKQQGYYNPDTDGEFSFVDAYCPLDPTGLLFCEGRVWSLFNNAAPSLNLSTDYWRCVQDAEPYPLYIKPDKKLSVADVFDLFRDHFDGTEFDLKKGMGSAPFGNPSRWKPLTFKIDGDTTQYAWERPISTQQTAFSFVSQMRSWLPREIGGIFWYGVDDNYTNVYVPIYCSNLEPPPSSQGYSIKDFSLNSAFWVFNLVANLAYTKYDYAIIDIQKVQKELEDKFFAFQPAVEMAASEIYKKDRNLAVRYLTDYSNSQFEQTVDAWRQLWEDLVVKYNDGYINDVNKAGGRHPKGVGYGNEYLKHVIKERPGYYDVKWRKK
ncbi:MAG: C69 family dipeptidase [Candidatus Kapaibacterium sp.]